MEAITESTEQGALGLVSVEGPAAYPRAVSELHFGQERTPVVDILYSPPGDPLHHPFPVGRALGEGLAGRPPVAPMALLWC